MDPAAQSQSTETIRDEGLSSPSEQRNSALPEREHHSYLPKVSPTCECDSSVVDQMHEQS